jgi:DNA-directed RNA polymerase subunit RPC12/RpoP
MQAIPMEDGEWYLGFTCYGCAERFAVQRDPANGTQKHFHHWGHEKRDIDCPHCGHTNTYRAGQTETFKHRSSQSRSPA